MFCIPCGMEWHGKYGRRRKIGRIVIKAMKAYENAGGSLFAKDFDKLKFAATGWSMGGYEAELDTIGAEIGDITLELLKDTLQLTHPDHHPPERRALAERVTQELLALEPFIFPPPKRKPEDPFKVARDESFKSSGDDLTESLRKVFSYPCEDCADTTPSHYCDACRAEHEKRWQRDRERSRAKQRSWYRRRKLRREAWEKPDTCVICGKNLKRLGAKCCSSACRQNLYRQRKAGVPDKPPSQRQLAHRRERECEARIKYRWKRIADLRKGATVVVNRDGLRDFPRGTKLTIDWPAGWRFYVIVEGPNGKTVTLNRRDIDRYDVAPDDAEKLRA